MGLASKVCTLVASWTWLKECPSNAAKSVSGRRASAHDFRRAFVERMQAQGMPDSLLQQLTGPSLRPDDRPLRPPQGRHERPRRADYALQKGYSTQDEWLGVETAKPGGCHVHRASLMRCPYPGVQPPPGGGQGSPPSNCSRRQYECARVLVHQQSPARFQSHGPRRCSHGPKSQVTCGARSVSGRG